MLDATRRVLEVEIGDDRSQTALAEVAAAERVLEAARTIAGLYRDPLTENDWGTPIGNLRDALRDLAAL